VASDVQLVGIITGAEISALKNLQLYPNPVKNEALFIQFGEQTQGEITVLDALGDVVLSRTVHQQKHIPVSMKELANGVYFVRIVTPEGIVVQKIIVARD
jgi:hypothetical protein